MPSLLEYPHLTTPPKTTSTVKIPIVVLYLLEKAKVRTKKETNQKIAMDDGNIFGEEGLMKGPKSSDKEGEAM